ncbi:hypothetical protein [Luteibacter sp. E-22]|uniref:hypothetical protein n=1 Tax=Luteibacter sp. E-22 TaxID=3404050 RepID=UPI003CF61D96
MSTNNGKMAKETWRVRCLETGIEGTARLQTEMECREEAVWVEFDDGWKSYVPEDSIEPIAERTALKLAMGDEG